MILEALVLTADMLADATNGVNALLSAVPRLATDTTAPPAIATILDEARSSVAAQDRPPERAIDFPALLVRQRDAAVLEGMVKTIIRDGDVPVVIGYVHREADAAKATRNGLYTMRAVQRCLRAFTRSDQVAARQLHSVTLLSIGQMQQLALDDPWGDAWRTAALVVTWKARDDAP